LNQARIRPRGRAGDDSKILIVGRATDCIRGGELGSVEDVEKLRAELKAEPFVNGKSGSLEKGEVKIIHSFRAKPGIRAGLIAEGEVGRGRKTGSIEPPRCA
jgi:hypothetical protein